MTELNLDLCNRYYAGMSVPQQPYAFQPGSIPMNQGAPGSRKPGVVGIVMGIVLMVLGPGIGFAIAVIGSVGSAIDNVVFDGYISSDSEASVSLKAGIDYVIAESYNSSNLSDSTCSVTDPSGANVGLRNPSDRNSLTASFESPIVEFTANATGRYSITCVSESGYQSYSVQQTNLVEGVKGWFVGGLIFGAIAFLGGLAWLISTVVRRGRWDREHPVFYGPPMGYYYPPMG